MSADRSDSPQAVAVEQTSAPAVHPASARPSDQQPGTAVSGDDIGRTDTASPPRHRRHRWLWVSAILVLAGGTAAALVVLSGRDSDPVEAVLLDEPAPAFNGPTLDGPSFSLDDHRGEVVVVNVWASWCTVCKDEHPELEAAARRLGLSGVQFVGLNTMDTVEDARAFLEEMGGSSYPSVLDPEGRKAREWEVFGLPTTFLVDQRGRVRAKAVGAVTEEWLTSGVGDLLAHEQSTR